MGFLPGVDFPPLAFLLRNHKGTCVHVCVCQESENWLSWPKSLTRCTNTQTYFRANHYYYCCCYCASARRCDSPAHHHPVVALPSSSLNRLLTEAPFAPRLRSIHWIHDNLIRFTLTISSTVLNQMGTRSLQGKVLSFEIPPYVDHVFPTSVLLMLIELAFFSIPSRLDNNNFHEFFNIGFSANDHEVSNACRVVWARWFDDTRSLDGECAHRESNPCHTFWSAGALSLSHRLIN